MDQELIQTLLDVTNFLEIFNLNYIKLMLRLIKIKMIYKIKINKQKDEKNLINKDQKRIIIKMSIHLKHFQMKQILRITNYYCKKEILKKVHEKIRNYIVLKGILIYKSLPEDYCTKLRFDLLKPDILVRNQIKNHYYQQMKKLYDKFIKEEQQDLGFQEKIKGFNKASELTSKKIDNLKNKLKENEDIRKQLEEQVVLYQLQQRRNSFLDQPQGRNIRKNGTLLIQSSNNLDFEKQTKNKRIEAVLLKENQQLKLYKLKDEILSITSQTEKPQIQQKLLQIRILKMIQLKSMTLNDKFDARNQAAKFQVKQSGIKITNTVFMDTLQPIRAN